MASANHSEQKGQAWGEERERTQPLPSGPSLSRPLPGDLTQSQSRYLQPPPNPMQR